VDALIKDGRTFDYIVAADVVYQYNNLLISHYRVIPYSCRVDGWLIDPNHLTRYYHH
jgi:hypothetical protein